MEKPKRFSGQVKFLVRSNTELSPKDIDQLRSPGSSIVIKDNDSLSKSLDLEITDLGIKDPPLEDLVLARFVKSEALLVRGSSLFLQFQFDISRIFKIIDYLIYFYIFLKIGMFTAYSVKFRDRGTKATVFHNFYLTNEEDKNPQASVWQKFLYRVQMDRLNEFITNLNNDIKLSKSKPKIIKVSSNIIKKTKDPNQNSLH